MNNFLWLGEDSHEVTIMQRLRRKKESIQVLKRRVATTGFFAGLIWSTVWTFLAFFNFSELSLSSFFLEGWTDAKWVEKWPGQLLSIFLWSILSIGVAYIYYLFFRRLTGVLPGLVYGVVIWLIMIILSSSLILHIPAISQMDLNTIVTTLSILIIYGVFIGYTISYDFLDQPSK